MPLPVEVAGLDAVAPEVPDGRVLLIEGGATRAKAGLLHRLARTSADGGRKPLLITTRAEPDSPVEAREVSSWPAQWPDGRDVFVDSFSLLALDAKPLDVADRIRAIRRSCLASGAIAALVLDDGQLDPAATAAARHIADGIIQFQARDDPEGPVPFLRVPKWMDGGGADRNLYYGFDGRHLLIDTRRRVN